MTAETEKQLSIFLNSIYPDRKTAGKFQLFLTISSQPAATVRCDCPHQNVVVGIHPPKPN